MSIFSFLAAFLMIRRLQGALKNSPLQIKWKNSFLLAQGTIIVLYFALSKLNSNMAGFVGAAVLFGLTSYADKEPDFISFRPFLKSHYPLAAVTFLTALIHIAFSNFYDEWDNVLYIIIIAAFIWILAQWTSAQKQQNELRMANERKTELEALVAERTAEIVKQKDELQVALEELKTTQAQLIQSEKMASLGELTAGIAHEIQNPLNFVNNFSEVSIELIEEMEIELNNGDKEEVIAIAEDIKQNLAKIKHHGSRADGIVKGMLQHSRASSNTKETTDINKLADEYLRLAYHGLRAKDKSFNAELVTHFEPSIPMINVVPQDVGRVLLNLFTNAFYATQQRQKSGEPGYRPTVEVTTATQVIDEGTNGIVITVKDNGTGIPEQIREKIMQPFFTTKPTGEGTGLGLSLSYDIIVKGHGGQLQVNSQEGQFTEFVIHLPLA